MAGGVRSHGAVWVSGAMGIAACQRIVRQQGAGARTAAGTAANDDQNLSVAAA